MKLLRGKKYLKNNIYGEYQFKNWSNSNAHTAVWNVFWVWRTDTSFSQRNLKPLLKIVSNIQCTTKEEYLNLIQGGHFQGFSRMGGGGKKAPRLPKICRTYPTMMKLGTVIPHLRKMLKYISHVTHCISSADISIFSPEISKFCYVKKYRYKLHFDT